MAFAITFSTNIAEAAPNIHYHATNSYTVSGQVVVEGYFYNSGNSGGTVKLLTLRGNAGGVDFGGRFNLNIYVPAGGKVAWTCSISESRIRPNARVNVQSSTEYGY